MPQIPLLLAAAKDESEYGIIPKNDNDSGNNSNGNAAIFVTDSSSSAPPSSSSSSSYALTSQRWCYLAWLSLAVVCLAFKLTAFSGIELESTVAGVMRSRQQDYDAYEPLVGREGGIYQELTLGNVSRPTSAFDKGSEYNHTQAFDNGDGVVPAKDEDEEGDGNPSHSHPPKNNDMQENEADVNEAAVDSRTQPMEEGGHSSANNVAMEKTTNVGNSTQQGGNGDHSHPSSNTTTTAMTTTTPPGKDRVHPRVACFARINDDDDDGGPLSACHPFNGTLRSEFALDSIPSKDRFVDSGGKKKRSSLDDDASSSSEDYINVRMTETKECKLSDPSYQAMPSAPSTCNDVHAMGFRFGPTDGEPMSGVNDVYTSQHSIEYLTSGGFRSVWTVTRLDGDDDDDGRGAGGNKVIMKTSLLKKGWTPYYLDQNRRDALVSGRASSGGDVVGNVLPMYQYCAFSSVVPYASAGVLDDYVYLRRKRGNLMSAEEQYSLALQAARGLYRSQLYSGGQATHVHADVKPPQFLLFERPMADTRKEDNGDDLQLIMQINDFNRGKFLTRSIDSNETCSFRMCNVHHKGSLYRSPEEYMECADQSDRIDVYSLGGVFFYLLSDGNKPWFHVGKYDTSVKLILKGEKARLPTNEEYVSFFGEKTAARLKERSKHPLFVALNEIMMKCWEFKPKDRPSSLQVVEMLEEKWKEISLSSAMKNSQGNGLLKWINQLVGGHR